MDLKLYLINTNRYYLKKITPYVYFTIICICTFFVYGKDHPSYLQAHNAPVWVYISLYLLLFYSVIQFFVSSFNNTIIDKQKYILIDNNSLSLFPLNKKFAMNSLHEIELLIDTTTVKRFKKRKVLAGGGNNWLILHHRDGKKTRIEFYFDSKEMEEKLIKFMENLGFKVKIGKASEPFINKLLNY